MSSVIQQSVLINAKPERVYQALLDSGEFSAFTGGAVAHIERGPGGAFSCFGGMITGRQLELTPNSRIVQAWRAGNWPEGTYSIVSFELAAEAAGTRLTLKQSGHPDDAAPHLEAGWPKNYWEPLKAHFG